MLYDLESQFDVIYEHDEARINCVFCGDDEGYHLYINENKGVYHCFRCDTKGTLRSLIRQFKLQAIPVAYKEFIHTPLESIQLEVKVGQKMEGSGYAIPSIRLEDFQPLGITADFIENIYYKYIRGRDVRVEDILSYKLHYTNSGKYRFRLIFPCFENEQFVYFTARTILSDPNVKRYINPPKGLTPKTRSDVIFNIDGIPQGGEDCIIFEGCLNSIIAGKDAVATFGKCVSESQIRLLLNKDCKQYTVALDPDARVEAYELAKKLINRGKRVRVATFPEGTDASDLGRDRTRMILEDAKVLTYSNIDVELLRIKCDG